MKFALPKVRRASRAACAHAVDFARIRDSKDGDDVESVASSLSSRSDHDSRHIAAFENGVVVKRLDESVLIGQAADSLRSTLDLIGEASNKRGSWVDARDLLDRTAAALDDAGLALRGRTRTDGSVDGSVDGSRESAGSGATVKRSLKSNTSAKKSPGSGFVIKRNSRRATLTAVDLPPTEELIRSLADEVVDKRRRLLGDMLVHDADGVWTKSEYGDGDGISFGEGDELPQRVPEEYKDDRALVAWASQTGTAKKFARRLHTSLGGNGRCVLKCMKDITLRDLAMHKRVYFVCSTFGMGRPPREGELFYSLVQLGAMRCKENTEDLSEGEVEKPLEGTSVAIAALGSSAFKDFARFGFGLAQELESLGVSMALGVTTLDAKNGRSAQKKAFQTWEDTIVKMEDERLGSSISEPSRNKVAPSIDS
mmetsp:Transcript_46946/g.142180  ORF Transcript_46946/g.142180 Transcript_46946/m.142180 type:complete len:425 (-) Transcript_46946:130-1404(-)